MNCPNCNTPFRAHDRFCRECGAQLTGGESASPVEKAPPPPGRVAAPPAPTPDPASTAKLARMRQVAEQMIEEFLRGGGVADPAALMDEHGRYCFTFGSARCRAAIVEDDGELYLHADAYVMPLPSDKELIVPLMRELLELNLSLRGAVRVGIGGESVIAMAIRPLLELQRDEFVRCIESVMMVADQIDDHLTAKYGGTAKQRAPGKRRKG